MDVQFLDGSITLGATTSFLAEVRMFDTNQQKHVLRTALRGIQVEYEGFLPKGSTVVAIIDVKVVNAGSTPQVKAEASSQVILGHICTDSNSCG